MLTLGAIVSVGMQMPDRGLLQAAFVLLCALGFQQGTTWIETRSAKFEAVTEGEAGMLVKNGVLQLDEMKRARISRDGGRRSADQEMALGHRQSLRRK